MNGIPTAPMHLPHQNEQERLVFSASELLLVWKNRNVVCVLVQQCGPELNFLFP